MSKGLRVQDLLDEAQRLTDEAGALWNRGDYPGVEALCSEALDLTRAAVGNGDPRFAERLYNLAGLYYLQRRYEEAVPLYHEAVLVHEAQPTPDCLALAYCFAWLGKALIEGWRENPGIDADDEGRSFRETEACYRRALLLLEEAGAAASAEYAGCLLNLGFLHYYCDRPDLAEPAYCQALALRESIFGPDHLETAEAVGRLAILYLRDETCSRDPEPLLRRALVIRENQLDAADPDLWEWIYRLADYCARSARNREATDLYSRLARLIGSTPPPDDDVNWIVAGCLDFLNQIGETDATAAIEALGYGENPLIRTRRVELKRREKSFGADHPRVAETLCALADDLRFQDEIEEAESHYRRALSIMERSCNSHPIRETQALNGLAMVLRAQNRLKAAREVLERAIALPFSQDSAAAKLEHARALEQLAWVHAAQRNVVEADRLYDNAIRLVESGRERDFREIAEMRYRLSLYCFNQDRCADAEASMLAALGAAERTTKVDILEVADYRDHYAAILNALGRSDEADAQLAEVARIWQSA